MNKTTSKESVSFGDVSVQEYPTELGEHPCCSHGVSIQIGWTALTSQTCSLDTYERIRSQEKCSILRTNLAIPLERRVEMLLDVGYSIHDIALATLKVEAIQESRRESLRQAKPVGRKRFHSIIESTSVTIRRAQSLPKGVFRTTSQGFRKIVHKPCIVFARGA